MSAAAVETALLYGDFKVLAEKYTGLDRDALHVHLSLFIYLLSAMILRQSRRSRLPWLVVLAFEFTNEIWDLVRQYVLIEHAYGDDTLANLDWHESAKDLWNTMLWPTALLLLGRYTNLFRRKDADAAADKPLAPVEEPRP